MVVLTETGPGEKIISESFRVDTNKLACQMCLLRVMWVDPLMTRFLLCRFWVDPFMTQTH